MAHAASVEVGENHRHGAQQETMSDQQESEQWQRCEPAVFYPAKDGLIQVGANNVIEITNAVGEKFHCHLPPEYAIFRRVTAQEQDETL